MKLKLTLAPELDEVEDSFYLCDLAAVEITPSEPLVMTLRKPKTRVKTITAKEAYKFVLSQLKEEIRKSLKDCWEESDKLAPFEEEWAEELKIVETADNIWKLIDLLDDLGYDDSLKLEVLICDVLKDRAIN